MCYDVAYQTKRTLEYAKRRGYDPETIRELEEKWERVKHIPAKFHTSGFEHPQLIGFTNTEAFEPQPLYWGLIPFWVKDEKSAVKISNQTLNARGESIFEKPAFREAAKNKRCLLIIDHFYEHHHFKSKTYPFLIKMKNDEPIILGGLWSEWVNRETGELVRSTSIVTTSANELLGKIHNNPKMDSARMPLMLSKDNQEDWLMPINSKSDEEHVRSLIKAFDADELEAYSVSRLRGKNAVGNTPEAVEPVRYPELEDKP